MKEMRLSMRLVAILLAACVLATGAAFVVTVYVNGTRWINRANNTRLADAKKTTVQGSIYDAAGLELAGSNAPGERHYLSDTAMRRALSHTLGDQTNMSATGVENFHASTLLGITRTRTDYTLQRLVGYDPVGSSLTLTVDAELTKYLASLLPSDKNGAAVIINYRTGAILAMVSKPDFDPADMSAEVKDTAYYNRVLQMRYAPGSTFKIITLTAALETLPGVDEEMFNCAGVWNYGDHSLKCAGNAVHGNLTLSQAFARSCNITFGSLAYRLGAKTLKDTAERFGFNFNFAFNDLMLYESWCLNKSTGAGDLIQAGFGQGTTQVTPLHMAMIAGAIANGGAMMEPKLISKVYSPAGAVVKTLEPAVFRQCTDAETAETVARYMYQTVKNGTASRAAISGYTDGYVCGKTGSAEWSNDKDDATHAWYAGFLYGDDAHPYAIAVVVEKGGSGGSVAAPIAAKALKKAIERNVY